MLTQIMIITKPNEMKKEEIKIRITESLKKDFRDICEFENTTMSNKIHDFIVNEIKNKKLKNIEDEFYNLLTLVGIENIIIIKGPSEIILSESGPKRYMTSTYNCDFNGFVEENKEKKIYLYLIGSEITKNLFRAFVI